MKKGAQEGERKRERTEWGGDSERKGMAECKILISNSILTLKLEKFVKKVRQKMRETYLGIRPDLGAS